MNPLKNIFNKKDESIKSYTDFWDWFQQHEKTFFEVVKKRKNIERDFFDHLSLQLARLKDGYYYLTGMYDENTVELVFTADGIIRNIVFIEELVSTAPKIDGWKFTALKPALDISSMGIEMGGYNFDKDKICFYSNDAPDFPDKIDISIVHDDFTNKNKDLITNGVYVFLDNYLGELNFATIVDEIDVIGKKEAQKELIPIEKLKDFLIWREKEFIEKYDGTRHDTENDNYATLQTELENGTPLLAILNNDLLNWDSKASHPWILHIEIKYDGKDNNGMPDNQTYDLLNQIEDEILEELKDNEGYLNIGRETGDNLRDIYFACRDFRKPSKVLHLIQGKYSGQLVIVYHFFKDKYWQSFDRFRLN